MANEMEEILRRVAAGELTPQEALPLLDAAGGGRSAAAATPDGTGTEPPAWGTFPGPQGGGPGEPATGPVRVVRINASYRPIQIVADPSVAEAKQEVNDILASVIADAVDHDALAQSEDVVRVLGHVWFAALVSWVGGMAPTGQMGDDLEITARLILDR